MASDIVVVGAARTPIGAFGGSLRDMAAYDLGAIAIRAALERAGIPAQLIDQVIYGNCRQAGNGPNPARTAAVRGGIPAAAPVFTVNMACPSAMKSVMLAARELAAGEAKFVLAGGMESMSTMPYLLKGARWEGFKSGDKTLTDSWSDTIDPLCGFGMGMTAENLVQKYSLTREEQDAFAVESQRKAAAARAAGHFDSEIVPVPLEKTQFSADEAIRPESNTEKLAKLRPVFKKDGTVTAGNACAMGDAACALVVTTRAHAAAQGLKPLFSIVAFAEAAVEPATMGEGPGASIPRALARADLKLADMDAIEVNEAFAAQMLANERVLKWDRAKVNRFGGAIALGHPTGFSGGRLLMALDNVLRRTGGELGVAGICGGGGVTTAVVIRRES
ncbi:MAG: acetyl-CoA acetyltransferase [Betaproteobacteria bacterium RIFCSPLOWO2_12_FULL_65_14]|nr:MAG: acetyl-CoA acetyltransferase [Betaproteobacteria bacterium RIFCSPLOWO2_12_FULL_65_14]